VGLGWTPREAEDAVAAVAADAAADAPEAGTDAPEGGRDDAPAPDVPSLLRAALRVLAPR
jgi:RuvA, C-terminal domain